MKRIVSIILVILHGFYLVACSVSPKEAEKIALSEVEIYNDDSSEKDEKYADVDEKNIDEMHDVYTTDAKYDEACELIEKGDYIAAQQLFKEVCEDERAKEQLEYFYFFPSDMSSEEMTAQVSFNDKGLPVQCIVVDNYSRKAIHELTWSDDLKSVVYDLKDRYGESITLEWDCNETGNKIKDLYTNSYGYIRTFDYTYDEDGCLIKSVYTNSRGEIETTDYIYDTDFNLIQEIYTDSAGDVVVYDYAYDEVGNLIKKEFTHSSGNLITYNYVYDEKGNMIKEEYNSGENYSETYNYSYDENGNMIKKEVVEHDGDSVTFDFEYKLVYIPKKLPKGILEELDWEMLLTRS